MLSRKLIMVSILAVGLSSSLSVFAKSSTKEMSTPAVASSVSTAPVNINTGDLTALENIKGLGPTKAQAIVDYRTKNGHFQSIEDLDKVPGIGPKLLEKIQPQVTV